MTDTLCDQGPTVVEQPAAHSQCDMLMQAGYDGVLFMGVEKAEAKALKRFLKMLNKLRNMWVGKMFLIDSPTLFVSEPSLPARLHGLLLCNPLTEENGEPKLRSGPAYDTIARALREAQLQSQQRSDFVALAWERLSLPKDALKPETVPRCVAALGSPPPSDNRRL